MKGKEAAARVLCALGLPAAYRAKNRNRLLILMYHGVSGRPLAPACWHQMPLASFARQMAWVARRYRVLPLSEALVRAFDGTLPPRAAAITFDDGYRNVATNAFPVLRSLGLPSTVFLPTATIGTDEVLWPDRLYLAYAGTSVLPDDAARAAAYAGEVRALKALPRAERDARLASRLAELGARDRPRPGEFRAMTWEDVARLAATGLVDFGAHSVTHEILSKCDDAEVARQVSESHREVARRLGREPASFAYPNGRLEDFDGRARAAVAALGVRFALSTVDGFCDVSSDPLALPRVGVGAEDSFALFRLEASGVLRSLRSG